MDRSRLPAFSTLLRIALGAVFVYASVDKIVHPAAFAQAVDNYHILPPVMVHPFAMILPWIEVLCGAALITGRYAAGGALVASVLMAVFLAAFSINLARGLDVNCGCFTLASESVSSAPALLARDGALLAVALWVLVAETRKELVGT